ncbi:MAG: tetratricopeptide repeat protein [Treponema sp.]|nr:tetratricopeptide repeat protein [Treponema sp.]MCL2251031.1 tetratricopeptide repeat protein [Treponema sp.]
MPSLNELKEFKASFHNIANERKDVISRNLPFDDMALPEKDAPSFEYSRKDNMPGTPIPSLTKDEPSADDLSNADANTEDVSNEQFDSDEPFDFSALLNDPGEAAPVDDMFDSQTDTDLNQTEFDPDPELNSFLNGLDPSENDKQAVEDDGSSFLADLLNDTPQTESQPPSSKDEDLPEDDSSFPEDLLSGFSEEMESSSDADIPEEDHLDDFPDAIDMGGENQSGDMDTSFNMPDDFPLPMDEFSEDSSVDDLDGDSIDMGGETRTGEFTQSDISDDDSSSLDGLDFPSDDSSFPSNDSFADDGGIPSDGGFPADSGSFSDDDPLSGLDFPGGDSDEDPLSGLDFPTGDDDASGGMDFPAQTASEDDILGDLGDLGGDFTSDSIDLDLGDTSVLDDTHDSGNDDFVMPELDMFLDKPKDIAIDVPVKKRFSFGRKKKPAEEAPSISDVEEISLSQDDVNKLLQTLSVYPLNLRIACEEAIAEQVILPQQLSKLIRFLVTGAPVKETAALVEEITGKPIVIPKSFEKSTGAAFEAEQASFAYIFVHNFLPVFRLVAVIVALAASVAYLSYRFIYIPLKAESLYKRGYERIFAGEYQRANDLFHQGFTLHRNKKWFYAYAENFRDHRRYLLAEGKYDELLRYYPRDKKGVLDYADMQTNYLLNYDKANNLLQKELLDYAPNDMQGLLAAGDNFLAWADSDPERFGDRYEDARFSYARVLENYGWQAPVLERMLKYFIRTDNLKEVLELRVWFENDEKRRKMTTESLAELGGYLLDKQMEKPVGVPNPYIESIESVRVMLLKAIAEDRYLPESHYHLARYHKNLGNTYEERLTLENAIRAFDLAKKENVKRRLYRVDAHYRYSQLLVNNKEFFPAETQIVRGIELYEEYLTRNLIRGSPQLGQLYAAKGDLEFYTKTGDKTAATTALNDYRNAERYGYTPPDMQYRMGAAYYQLEDWGNALTYLFRASAETPYNRRMLYALGNAAYKRGDFYVAQGYFSRLLDILENQRIRLPVLMPNDSIEFLEVGERLMMARNNAGVVYEALAEQTGNREYRSRAMALYAESARAWDAITRNPVTMTRMRLSEIPGAPGINLGYLNANNALRPTSNYNPSIFTRIDRDGLEPSHWEQIASFGN